MTATQPSVAPSMPGPADQGSVLTNIQVLRGLAALLVVFVHLQDLARLGGASQGVFSWGNSGVDVFFVISGLIMVQATTRRPVGPALFMRQRLARVVPLYWLVTLGVFGLVWLWPGLFSSTDADPIKLAKSLAFIPYERPDGELHPLVFLGWTLNYEMAFYLLFSVGLLAGRARLVLPLVVLGLAVVVGLIFAPTTPVARFYTAPVILEFAAGMLLGAGLGRLPQGRRAALAAAIAGAFALVLMLIAPALWPEIDRAVAAGLPALVIVAAALVLEKSGHVATWPLARRIGDASYSIYLTHFFITAAVTKLAAKLGITGLPALAGLMLVAFALVILVGLAVHQWVETPLTRLFKPGASHWSRLRASSATAKLAPTRPLDS